jgi:hypothetical protein
MEKKPRKISFLARGVRIPKRKQFEKRGRHISFISRVPPKRRDRERIYKTEEARD